MRRPGTAKALAFPLCVPVDPLRGFCADFRGRPVRYGHWAGVCRKNCVNWVSWPELELYLTSVQI